MCVCVCVSARVDECVRVCVRVWGGGGGFCAAMLRKVWEIASCQEQKIALERRVGRVWEKGYLSR